MDERLEKQIRFALEIDQEKLITRQTHLTHHGRYENDAEHAWHMAVMVWLLREYANEPVDIARTMMMCLLHDVVEIDAGDTFAYDAKGKETQAVREAAAKERIFGLLPEDQRAEFAGIFEEFEANETPEAHFAHALDNFQPMMLNNSNGGSDWKEHYITESQVRGRHAATQYGSEVLFRRTNEMIRNFLQAGLIHPDRAEEE